MQYYIENWRKITSDENILDIVQHCHFEFDEDFSDCQFHVFQGGKFTESESIAIDNEISSLLAMNVITEVDHSEGEVISPIFIVPKKDGEYRMILNLKKIK